MLLFFCTATLMAQYRTIETDIFGDLIYENRAGNYKANLKRNIFNDLIFTDNRKNSITLEKKYLDREYPGIHSDKELKADFFFDLISQHRRSNDYVAKYSIDIFNKLIITDNKGYKLEKGTDIFGHDHFEEEIDGVKTSMKKTLNGTLEFSVGSDKASLTKDIFNKWIYKDSFGNEIQFADKTWQLLMRRYQTDERAFMSLIDQFFYLGD